MIAIVAVNEANNTIMAITAPIALPICDSYLLLRVYLIDAYTTLTLKIRAVYLFIEFAVGNKVIFKYFVFIVHEADCPRVDLPPALCLEVG